MPTRDVIVFGTQVVVDATTVGAQVVTATIESLVISTSSVDTEDETLIVETTDVPKRVAVGDDWQAIQNYSWISRSSKRKKGVTISVESG